MCDRLSRNERPAHQHGSRANLRHSPKLNSRKERVGRTGLLPGPTQIDRFPSEPNLYTPRLSTVLTADEFEKLAFRQYRLLHRYRLLSAEFAPLVCHW